MLERHANREPLQMINQEWEATVNTIIEQYNQQTKEAGKNKVLSGWRAKLKREPTFLSPQKIDEIVREVRRRITAKSESR